MQLFSGDSTAGTVWNVAMHAGGGVETASLAEPASAVGEIPLRATICRSHWGFSTQGALYALHAISCQTALPAMPASQRSQFVLGSSESLIARPEPWRRCGTARCALHKPGLASPGASGPRSPHLKASPPRSDRPGGALLQWNA